MDFPDLSAFGLTYVDLYDSQVLEKLTVQFHEYVHTRNPSLHARFGHYQALRGAEMSPPEVSSLLEEMAEELSSFIGNLFGIMEQLQVERDRSAREKAIFECRREFFVRRVLKKYSKEVSLQFDRSKLSSAVRSLFEQIATLPYNDPELEAATVILQFLDHERYIKVGLPVESVEHIGALVSRLRNADWNFVDLPSTEDEPSIRQFLTEIMSLFERWLAAAFHQRAPECSSWTMLHVPSAIDFNHLVQFEREGNHDGTTIVGNPEHFRRRNGFDLTDARFDERHADGEVDYCILCHKREKDSCSHGFMDGSSFKHNPLGYELKGCPLDQKISESHELKSKGDILGALALIMMDNPMLPGTGHRICNDCMKGCIYQKQDPVNIPQVETRILTDVLSLPWGFEIYSLLTRWNPLKIDRPYALPFNGMKILIVGMGPAGYTLAHYFLNEGFGVVGIDGLKIEPLSEAFFFPDGSPRPIRNFGEIQKKLSERSMAGFGGVSEYGITPRWDKNFLTVIHLTLLRRRHFALFDGVRFGGTLTIDDAWNYGFDHVCIAAGAGKPTFVHMKNNMIRGIRKASDFLMALQLTGAGKKDSLANLQVRLPAVVIGGGLTAIDAATELMAYYPVQVSKIKERFDILASEQGRDAVLATFDPEERGILMEFLAHAESIDAERSRATAAGEQPVFIPLLRQWGGVTILYRKSINDSPAYRLNHEEIIKGLEEGIAFKEKMSPVEAVPDSFGALQELIFEEMELMGGRWKSSGRHVHVPARTAIIAAGTVPNIMYEREHPGTFDLDANEEYFLGHRLQEGVLVPSPNDPEAFFASHQSSDGRTVSFYGDNHPAYAGSVVKAMASAKHGYRHVVKSLESRRAATLRHDDDGAEQEWRRFRDLLSDDLQARVVRVNKLTPTITEIVARAPKAAREFHPGQFYRLQNYEADSRRIENSLLMMEGIALTGAWVDPGKGEIGMIALEVGASSRMSSMLAPDQRIVVMGPTGTPTEIGGKETVLLLGGGLGNAVLFSIGRAFREKGGRVIYFAGYKKQEDFFKREWLEAASDVLVFSVDGGSPIPTHRAQDRTFVGNIVQAAVAYATGKLGPVPIPLHEATRVIAIGSDRMMAAVKNARGRELKPFVNAHHIGIASINSPMQCMMKAICAQCLQRHVDPATGVEEFVFSCVNQDQPMDHVDFVNLNARLRQNTVMEKLSNLWLEHLLQLSPVVDC